ncbi:aspartic proteinase [Glycine max]|uniref:aspartic proteinase n=1 Tax=Glycine max TaxID=3847 RepID=UPI001B3558AE|nr:aspartic proteinase [Glycine max]
MVTEKEQRELSTEDTALCTSCQMLVVWIQNQLKQKKTKEIVFNYVNQLCESLPSPNGESVVDCNSIYGLPNITFTVGDKPFTHTPEQYILKTGEGIAEVCLSGFIAFDIPFIFLIVLFSMYEVMHGTITTGAFDRDEPRGYGSVIPTSASPFAEVALEAPAVVTIWC